MTATNDVFSGSSPNKIAVFSGFFLASHCDIGEALGPGGDGVTDNGGNLDVDPAFVTPYTDGATPFDLHLLPGSACLMAGATQAQAPSGVTIPTMDITGQTRPATPSIGAYEEAALSPTAVSLSATPGADVPFGNLLTLSAAVSNTGGGATPTGTVGFTLTPVTAGGQALGAATSVPGGSAVPLTGGLATVGAGPAVGFYRAAAAYSPSGAFLASAFPADGVTADGLALEVDDPTATAITATSPSGGVVSYGQPLSVTATVTPASHVGNTGATPTPAGTVTFTYTPTGGSAVTDVVPVSGGAATDTPSLPVGSFTAVASYTPDHTQSPTAASASAGTAITVQVAPTSTMLTYTPGNTGQVTAGQSAAFTAAVTPSVPGGSVTFTYTPNGVGSVLTDTTPLPQSGTVTDAPTLPVGTYTVTASVSGNSSYQGSTGGPLTETVIPATVAVTGVSARWGTQSAPLTVGPSLLPAGRKTDVPWAGVKSFTLTLAVTLTGKSAGPLAVSVTGSGTSYVVTLSQPLAKPDVLTLAVGGTSVTAYTGTLPVLPGDLTDDGVVNASDLALARNAAVRITPVAPAPFGDVNGDGLANITDYNLVHADLATVLP